MAIKDIFRAKADGSTNRSAKCINVILVGVFVVIVSALSLAQVGVTFDFSFVPDFSKRIIDGFKLTLQISLASLVFSLVIGILAAIGQNARTLFIRYIAELYIAIIRGTPLIMQIYLFFYIVGTAWGVTSRFWAGVIILSIFEGAYIAEIIRGGLASIDESQREAARAVGYTRGQMWRYIIIPQMISHTVPALAGQFASIIKDSSLLSIIAVIELTQTMREISATNFLMFECYFLLGGLYLIMTLPISFASKKLEKRFSYEN